MAAAVSFGSGLSAWAEENEETSTRRNWRMRSLLRGERDGTVRHPFPVTDRDDYLARIKGKGIVAKVDDAPIKTVDLRTLHGIQKTVSVERLKQHLEDENLVPEGKRSDKAGMLIDVPVVVKMDGELYLHDGHHRATAAWVKGERAIGARVVDLDRKDTAT